MQEDDTEVQEAVEIVTTLKLMTEVVTAAATQVTAASIHIPAAKPKTLTITAAPAISTRKRKGIVIRDPEEELHTNTLAETPTVKDKGKGILIEALKPMKKKDQSNVDDVSLKLKLFKGAAAVAHAKLAFAAIFVKIGVLQIGTRAMVIENKEISPPKDVETPVESSIPVSPSLSVGSSSPIRSTTSLPDYFFDELSKWSWYETTGK
uniref:Uncharacterized protein n=1 Tax=Tanacetum cinerariifolium TaxID=118510 RepID=A0A6L2LV87_TANCI|nr:hypothetical protein [Tanacetum cinerariifolium]